MFSPKNFAAQPSAGPRVWVVIARVNQHEGMRPILTRESAIKSGAPRLEMRCGWVQLGSGAMGDIEATYSVFCDELVEQAGASGEPLESIFFQTYLSVAVENGDCIDLDHCPMTRDGRGAGRIDGIAFDAERGALYVAICDFQPDDVLQPLHALKLEQVRQKLVRFVEQATDPAVMAALRPDDPEFEAFHTVWSQLPLIRRIRAVIFSNRRLATARPPESAGEIGGIPVVYNILDFARFAGILDSRTGGEPIEIDLEALDAPPLICLPASTGAGRYASYLAAMPGETLAAVYALYGPRLLEQNVRTFLQAKTKVNKGIIRTIREQPDMFFAFNNGITATAAGITTRRAEGGAEVITALRGLQIVNGGQTTACILTAKDRHKADLSAVYVQMKLTIVDAAQIEEIVPRISRFANTQNRISEADFFSSHPFHIALEQISRRLIAPPRPGHVSGSKWFYERARGQYREGSFGAPAAARARFEGEYPKAQMIDKTALARLEFTFDCRPHTVCAGSQKCFLAFAEHISREWDASALRFNDGWYREVAAKAIIARWTDHMVGASDWYKADRAWKSQTVAYTLAWIVHQGRLKGKAGLDLSQVWRAQDVPDELRQTIVAVAPAIAARLRQTPESVSNVGEYAKHQACWSGVSGLEIAGLSVPSVIYIDRDEARHDQKGAAQARRLDVEIDFEAGLPGMVANAGAIADLARRSRVSSPRADQALRRLAAGDILLSPGERTALRQLLARLSEQGIELPPAEGAAAPAIADDAVVSVIRLGSSGVKMVKL